jgi:hypothetical protein
MSTRDYEEKITRINAVYRCAYSFVSALTFMQALEATVKGKQTTTYTPKSMSLKVIEGIRHQTKGNM